MRLEMIEEITPKAWDQSIEAFDSKCLFHESAWLGFIETTQKAKTVRFQITDNGAVQGYFAGLIVRKGPLKVLGSPLPGWTTDYMGPVVNKEFDFDRLLDALDDTCRSMKIDHIEICCQFLPPGLMRQKGYEVQEKITYVVPLGDEEEMRKNLDRKCKQNIRKGLSNDLVVETCSGLPSFIDEYYAQLLDVFARQKLVPSYSAERVRAMFRLLYPDSIVALQVKNGDQVIATGVFPYDRRSVYMFGAASYRKFQGLYPNELLYWTAMTHFAEKRIPQLDMCGDGAFKPKFGAREVPVYRYFKSYSMVARLGREAYRKIFYAKQAVSGRLSGLVAKNS